MKFDIVDILFIMLLTVITTSAICAVAVSSVWEKDALRAGVAHYEKSTGNFKWNGDTP